MYTVGMWPVSMKISIVSTRRIRCTKNFEMLVNVGIVETGYFIFVTRYRLRRMHSVPSVSISLM